MPVKGIIDAAGSLSDGEFTLEDITGPVGVGLEVLAVGLNPVAGVVGAALGPLMDWLVANVSFLKEPLDALLGDPPGIRSNGDRWGEIKTALTGIGEDIAAAKGDMPSWTGPGAEAYKPTMDDLEVLFTRAASAAGNFSGLCVAAGAIVGVVREVIWGAIKDAINNLVAEGIIAAAAAIPSLGASLAAYTAWAAARTAALAAWLSAKMSRLLTVLASLGDQGSRIAQTLTRAAEHLDTLAYAFGESSTLVAKAGDDVYRAIEQIDAFGGSGAGAVNKAKNTVNAAGDDKREGE